MTSLLCAVMLPTIIASHYEKAVLNNDRVDLLRITIRPASKPLCAAVHKGFVLLGRLLMQQLHARHLASLLGRLDAVGEKDQARLHFERAK